MGERQNYLKKIVKSICGKVYNNYLPRPKFKDIINSKYYDEVMKVYLRLGGKLDKFPVRVGNWDIEINNLAIELDEELHFNRYRKITLKSDIYSHLKKIPTKNLFRIL